jgi:hypothetical protein
VIEGYDIRKYELLFILFLAILSSGDLSFENLRIMMSSCMTKLKFLSKLDIIYILDEENICSYMLLVLL